MVRKMFKIHYNINNNDYMYLLNFFVMIIKPLLALLVII